MCQSAIKGNSKRTSGNSFGPLGAQKKEFGAALQTLLTEVKLSLRRRLHVMLYRAKSHMGKASKVGLSKQAIKWYHMWNYEQMPSLLSVAN